MTRFDFELISHFLRRCIPAIMHLKPPPPTVSIVGRSTISNSKCSSILALVSGLKAFTALPLMAKKFLSLGRESAADTSKLEKISQSQSKFRRPIKVIYNPSAILPIATEIFHFIYGQFNQFLVACLYHLGHMLPFLQNSSYSKIYKQGMVTINRLAISL